MSEREGTNEPGGADEIGAARDALHSGAIVIVAPQVPSGGSTEDHPGR